MVVYKLWSSRNIPNFWYATRVYEDTIKSAVLPIKQWGKHNYSIMQSSQNYKLNSPIQRNA